MILPIRRLSFALLWMVVGMLWVTPLSYAQTPIPTYTPEQAPTAVPTYTVEVPPSPFPTYTHASLPTAIATWTATPTPTPTSTVTTTATSQPPTAVPPPATSVSPSLPPILPTMTVTAMPLPPSATPAPLPTAYPTYTAYPTVAELPPAPPQPSPPDAPAPTVAPVPTLISAPTDTPYAVPTVGAGTPVLPPLPDGHSGTSGSSGNNGTVLPPRLPPLAATPLPAEALPTATFMAEQSVHVQIFIDLNRNRLMDYGEETHNVLVHVATPDRTWTQAAYALYGEAHLSMDGLSDDTDVVVMVPYLHYATPIRLRDETRLTQVPLLYPTYPVVLP